MFSKRIPLLKPRQGTKEVRFRRSLVRTVLIVFLLTSLFPILLIGTLNMVRSRDLLRRQVSRQSEDLLSHEISQISEYVELRKTMIDRMVNDDNFINALMTLLTTPSSTNENRQARSQISYSFRGNPRIAAEDFFDQLFIIRPDNTIALATDDQWIIKEFGSIRVKDPLINGLIGTNSSAFVFNPQGSGTNQLVLYTSRSFKNDQGQLVATLIATAKSDPSDPTYTTLMDAGTFLPGAKSYYFTPEAALLEPGGEGLSSLQAAGLDSNLKPMIGTPSLQSNFTTRLAGEPVYVFARWLPEYNLGVLLSVSEFAMLGQNSLIDPFNMALLVISLVISGTVIYFGSTRLVAPLVRLAQSADSFSKGNWNERAEVNRSDEIGLLAHSFNRMAADLGDLYHSLETAVENRTSTLRIASEIAQMATSTSRLDDTLSRTVELIAERFGYSSVSIFLLDESGRNLVLQDTRGAAGDQLKQRGLRVTLDEETLISHVAVEQKGQIITDGDANPLFRTNVSLPDTRSEVAIPIVLGSQTLGVLDIQSTEEGVFGEETITIFQALANQISNTVQSARQLESTQVSYQETSLLYRATRQVTQAQNEDEVLESLRETFIQLPYIGAVLSFEKENFRIQVITDAKSGRVETGLQNITIPAGRMAQLLEENRIILLDDLTQLSDFQNLVSFLLRRGCKAAALIAVMNGYRLSRVLVIGARESGQINHTGLQAYANLADVIGASLGKFNVLQVLNERLTELQVLTAFSTAISAETDLNRLYSTLHRQVMQIFGSELEFSVAIYNAPQKQIDFPYFYEKGETISLEPAAIGEGLTSLIIQSGQPLMLNDEASIRKHNIIVKGAPAKSWMGIPLIFAGTVVGAILVQDLTTENRFDQHDLNLFMTLAPQIATAVRNTQLYTDAQNALRAYDQERFLLNNLLDQIPEGISFKDTQGRYIRASSSTARSYNLRPEEMIGKTDGDLIGHEKAEKIHHDEQTVINTGKPEIGLLEYVVTPTGEENWLHTSRIPVTTLDGEPYGLLVITRDITELKKAEALAQRRAEQVLTSAEIARDATGTLEIDALLKKSVNLVRERFGFYHASIFLLDGDEEYAVLRESTGEAGEKMLLAGHRLAVGSKSIVGQVTASGKALIVNNVTDDPTHLPNPLLPGTRSELAIPLKVGDRILGALDVQSTKTDAFIEEDVNVLQILADQMAVAVVNGELFSRTHELLEKHRLLRQITTAASNSTSLEEALHSVVGGLHAASVGDRIAFLLVNENGELQIRASAGYQGTSHLEIRIASGRGITGQALKEKRSILVRDTSNNAGYITIDQEVRSELAIPVLFGDEVLGVLNFESTQISAFDENDLEILGALGSSLGGVIANIRLVNQVRQQVERERRLFDVTSQVRRSVDLGTILETSTREIARALGARRASIRINPEIKPLDAEVSGESHYGVNHSSEDVE